MSVLGLGEPRRGFGCGVGEAGLALGVEDFSRSGRVAERRRRSLGRPRAGDPVRGAPSKSRRCWRPVERAAGPGLSVELLEDDAVAHAHLAAARRLVRGRA